MVGRSYSLDESKDLRTALYEMKEDGQRLQEEVEAEREAAATSAGEAMSVILRLQGEKAALAMEASQYKRMVEEQMSHAEFSIELLEDLNYQKDVEIKNLESRLHAYRCKLMTLGRSAIDDHSGEDCMRCWDRSQTPSPETICTDLLVPVEKEVIEQSIDSSRRDEEKNLELYWQQIKKLDEELKELTDLRDSVRDQYKRLKQETVSMSETKYVQEKENIRDIASKENGMRKMSKKSYKKRDRSIKRDQTRECCSINNAEYQAEFQLLKERVERLERERCNTETQTNLQRKPEEELSSVQSEMKCLRTTQVFLPNDDSAINALQEAMLYFWL